MSTLAATRPIIDAKLAKAAEKRHRHGVLGLRAVPRWDGGEFSHDGTRVTVVPCPSTLAVWEALHSRADGEWLVILTPIEEDELGTGVLAHLLEGKLLTPDPWDALRSTFSATTIEPALYRVANDRALATGLLAVLPTSAYTPAPGGVLTRTHAMSAVARGVLGVTDDPATEIDTLAVLEWSRQPTAADAYARLAAEGGPELAASLTGWLTGRAGRLGPAVAALLAADRIADLVPLGLLAGLLDPEVPGGQLALGKFQGTFGLHRLGADDLRGWYQDAAALVMGPLTYQQCQNVLDAADRHVRALGIEPLAGRSELLPQGLHSRITVLADQIDTALPLGPVTTLPAIPADLAGIESAWQDVQRHFLAAEDPTCRAYAAAVRLLRWLAGPGDHGASLTALTQRHVDVDAWVDSALGAVRRGADLPANVATLRRVIETVTGLRRTRDRAFAAALADAPHPEPLVVEDLLARVVLPLAGDRPTLLLVLDGLSQAVATELIGVATDTGWTEAGVLGSTRRTAALAVLPTLTGRSRCSLLCGELREGTEQAERAGFLDSLRKAGLQAASGVPDPIFHKKALDSMPAGAALATDVANAVADTEGRPLVAAVLNYVDDNLHHTDPGRTDWTVDTITHLRPLLKAARAAGRAVVIASDHGHVIERRESTKRDRDSVYGLRAHGDLTAVADDEVLVRGPRVLTDSGAVVLAVDETVRYGPVHAGYHGGGSPAEVVTPVIVLHTGDRPAGLSELDPVQPDWWHAPVVDTATVAAASSGSESASATVTVPAPRSRRKTATQEPSLFDEPAATRPVAPGRSVADEVLATAVFRDQLRLAGRIAVSENQIRVLLAALLAEPSRELTLLRASSLLGIGTGRVGGALLQIKRVLDVEGYEVLLLDGAVRVDEAALREQFGIGS
ncbi:BREX-2 system phosphatase PglZ [Rhodococcus sp. BP-252]|uniref:BREX-2 system phosphatase PglZ n=1 Tax=unclassified Rhodococcus (in: high G+C Gram-positive bacteria) TaxID=192944 RepID=UPI001C9A7927|nr:MULTISPECIES: BREX-2 system phosphatase PglZ [unclassified Rhodococcus (in: high G+C Gram-positive bacteria)]MBY6413363.1 BREX-2 system phosphatase PglZ [Rhodococcus sp. BP-320]MBY6418033.1 BREX-2 system phosphatase PglZ [Rhodococcus sp. BP-321]MBY6422277.1 BREX-2 system phosphatase PglZ [Rhodococcus sp. BP-324]MBY6428082.1 BREX-2 system phosphatase PglZ [Rhodococcus sp. BP-323]MBY6433284.1 BREX-2 system phosphatase PglZ [Rhodococcus sp. BP-322]